ncbi:hypothetical protein [Mongoliibacter ruber]|uniref:Uncharacterized protein n=1 Tax=Mongoliibacter ruber TaxID=1750599 RepID=A0A2T0WV51_9BACT|nr:hypothetical protein [Mongoliibacter ruber]PRY90549.1 hypothetical protein CLW00_101211 [Mongoliibacter ruber]
MNDNQINKEALRKELVEIRDRISAKITNIVFTNQKLPFDRLSNGRQLKELVIISINAIDQGKDKELNDYIRELKKRGIQIKCNEET